MTYSQAEKLQLMMLCAIYRKLGINDSFDPELIEEAISSDNYWALGWEYPSLDTGEEVPENVKTFVATVDMYEILQYTYDRFSERDKAEIASQIPYFDEAYLIKFQGFDGDHESAYIGIGRMLEKMGRLKLTAEPTRNSHRPSVDIYLRMLEVFLPARANDWHEGRGISKESFIKTLNARIHPSNR